MNDSTKNLSQNGANYQHSGTENLRGNGETMYAPIISVPTSGPNHNAATKVMKGTENLRADAKDVTAKIETAKYGANIGNIPSTVDSFKDASV